jgi:2-polyprenyl-6-methoxyphenol hydroxylase-like FAD-dependent oxidoreductase
VQIVIVGAGIGGLATALSLRAAGYSNIRIVERVFELEPLGVGINLLPHAVRELIELGLEDQLRPLGIATSSLSYWNRFGQLIWSEPRGVAAGYRWPQLSVHRGELQMMLLDEVRNQLGAAAMTFGQKLIGVEHGTEADIALLEDAQGSLERIETDLIVAADGIHSALRRQHYPLENRPIWNGLTLWRGTALAAPFLDGRSMIMAGDAEQKFVAYPLVGPGDHVSRVNFIAERGAPKGTTETADWNLPADPRPIIDLFREWKFDWLDIPSLIGAADVILEYPMVDRDPIPRWTFGHSTLLGDAAHPMYPIGSNGASQAILDARVLAYELASHGQDIVAGLAAYERVRRPATSAIVQSNRQLGPERVMQIAYERAPFGFDSISDVMSAEELSGVAAEYKRAAGFHPELLNDRPSFTAVVSS